MSPEVAAWNAASAEAWDARTAELPPGPPLHRLACPLCKVDEPLDGTGVLPREVSWERYSGYGRNQQQAGLCALFGDLAMVEVQYVINSCERFLLPRLPGCPVRPGDDDGGPGLALVRPGTVDGRAAWELDLSEQLVVSCGEYGYHHVGAGSQGHDEFLGRVGTVIEALAPYRLEYVNYGPTGYDPTTWWPPRHAPLSGDIDPFYGTCPLAHRFGAGDGSPPFGSPERASDADWCEIAAIAAQLDPYGSSDKAVLFRAAWHSSDAAANAWHSIAEADLLGYLAEGYVVADTMNPAWSVSGPGERSCFPGACVVGGDCGGHVVLLIGYEDGGETLILRNSHGEGGPIRIRRGTCGVGVGGMRALFLGDPRYPATLRPSITSHAVGDRCSDPVLRDWLNSDADGDGIKNGWDVCLYSKNPGLLERTPGANDPRLGVSSYVLQDPVFLDDDAWPDDDPLDLADDAWDPELGLRRGCDSCPGFATADRHAGDDDIWGQPCDGCPDTPQLLYSQMDANRPSAARDPDLDWIMGTSSEPASARCDYCPDLHNRGIGNLDPDGDGLGLACDPCTPWWDLPPTHALHRPAIPDTRCPVASGDPDTDGDGIVDRCDNCCLEQNPLQEDGAWDLDTDGNGRPNPDGIGDACEPCPGVPDDPSVTIPDGDDDRVGDFCLGRRRDNCLGLSNPFQVDTDGDGHGDECDVCPLDPLWRGDDDSDGDGLGDVCDPCPYGHINDPLLSPVIDWDRDGWPNACDNCPTVVNPGQQNCDWRWEAWHWGVSGFALAGDACDADPCTGAPPVPGDVLLNPRARPGSPDDFSPIVSTWRDVPTPAVPQPVPFWRLDLEVGPFHSESTVGGTMTVAIPTTGTRYRQFCMIIGGVERCGLPVSTLESLPVMVRRCVCWDYVLNQPITDPATCLNRQADFCPNNGQVNFKWRDQNDLLHGPPQRLSGWLAAKVGPGLNYPRDEVGMEDVDYWKDLEQPVPQDPELETPPAAPVLYARQGGVWFDIRRRYEAGQSYPGWSVQWRWKDEVLPHGMDPDGDGVPIDWDGDTVAARRIPFVLWTRPHVVLDDPTALVYGTRLTNGTLAQQQWPLVAKWDARCTPGSPGAIDCDDFDNAYSPGIVWAQEIKTSVTTCSRVEDPGDRFAPIGDWSDWADPPDMRGMSTLDRVVMAIVRIVNPGDPLYYKFPVYDAAAHTQGLLVNPVRFGTGYADPMGFPSRMASGEPAINVSGFSVAFAAAPWSNPLPGGDLFGTAPPVMPEGRFYLFGGVDPSGTPSSKLWVGETEASTSTDPPAVEWRRAAAQGPQPPGLQGAALFVHLEDKLPGLAGAPGDPPGDWTEVDNDMLVVGGMTDTGALNANLWWYDADRDAWHGWGPEPGDRYAGAWPAVTWHDAEGYLYGGWDGHAPVEGLYRIDLPTHRLRRLDLPASPSPGPRTSASIAVTGNGEALYLYGGLTPQGWTNDVWRYDFRTGGWSEQAPMCASGQCPAVGPVGLTVESTTGRVFLVPMAADAQNQPWWLLENGRWVSARALSGGDDAGDCDGDGHVDRTVGRACRLEPQWWAPVGQVECDSVSGVPTCVASAIETPPVIERIEGFHDARFAIGPGPTAYLLRGRLVVPVGLADPARPRRRPPVHLAQPGRELLIHSGVLYAATEGTLEAFGLDDPERPVRLWGWAIPGGVDDLAASGATLAVIEPDGFRLLDVSNPARPEEWSQHRLVRVLPWVWRVDPPRGVRDLVRRLLPSDRRVGGFDGRTLVVGDRFDMIALDIAPDGSVVRRTDPLVLPGRVRELRFAARRVYTDTLGGFGFVVLVQDGDLDWEGIHALDGWADNAVYAPTAAYRSTCRGLEVAHAP